VANNRCDQQWEPVEGPKRGDMKRTNLHRCEKKEGLRTRIVREGRSKGAATGGTAKRTRSPVGDVSRGGWRGRVKKSEEGRGEKRPGSFAPPNVTGKGQEDAIARINDGYEHSREGRNSRRRFSKGQLGLRRLPSHPGT